MAVLISDRKTERKQGIIFALPVATATKIYSGSMVSVNSNGYVVPSSDISDEKFIGISKKEVDNSAGADGDAFSDGYMVGLFEMNSSGIIQADLASEAYAIDDNTVGHGIVAQPANVTGVVLERTSISIGGTRTLSYTAIGTLLSYGGGTAVDVSINGTYTLTATDGSTIIAIVSSASLPGADQSDSIQLRHQKAGRIIEVVSANSVFIDVSTAARS